MGSPTATSARHPKRDIASMLDGSVICEHSSSTTTSKFMPSSAALPHDAVVVPTTRTLDRALARLSAAPARVAASSWARILLCAGVLASFNISISSFACAAPLPRRGLPLSPATSTSPDRFLSARCSECGRIEWSILRRAPTLMKSVKFLSLSAFSTRSTATFVCAETRIRASDFDSPSLSAAATMNAASVLVLPLPNGPWISRTGLTVSDGVESARPASSAAMSARATASAWSSLSRCLVFSASASAITTPWLAPSSTSGAARRCGRRWNDIGVIDATLSNSARVDPPSKTLAANTLLFSLIPCAGFGLSSLTSILPSWSGPCHRVCATIAHGALFLSPIAFACAVCMCGLLEMTHTSPLLYVLYPRRSLFSSRNSHVRGLDPEEPGEPYSSQSPPSLSFFFFHPNFRNVSKRSLQCAWYTHTSPRLS